MPTSPAYPAFAKVFEVEILHDYYLKKYLFDSTSGLQEETSAAPELENQYDLRRELDLRPSPACALALKNAGMLFRTTRKGFFLGGQLSADSIGPNGFKPRIPFAADTVFTFEIRLKNPQWLNFSALPVEGPAAGQLYYFSNAKTNPPALNEQGSFSSATLDQNVDLKPRSQFGVSPEVYGIIELTAFVQSGSILNLIDQGVLNLTETTQGLEHPVGKINFASRELVWRYLNNQGTETARTAIPVPLARIQAGPLPLAGQTTPTHLPNPHPQNIHWDPIGQEYLADIYL